MTRTSRACARSVGVIWACALIAGAGDSRAQEPAISTRPAILLRVEGLVERPLGLTAEDLAKMPRQTVDAKGHDGQPMRFAGVTLTEVLKAAGVPAAEKLRGAQLSKFLLVEAADGYRAVFALPELDPAFTDTVVLLADRRDGQPLAVDEGPLRLVVAHEKRQARWVRQVQVLKVLQANP
jgi:DMSO/TMAO reductase YedYZ molybdopterin-dependent catalytic subunit